MAVQAAVLLARMAGAPCVRAEQSAVERPLHGVLNDTRQYRERFLITKGDEFCMLCADHTSYINMHDNRITAFAVDGTAYPLPMNMNDLEQALNPDRFFRLNRQYIANINGIRKISFYFSSKLIVRLKSKPAIGDGISWTTPCKRGEAEAQLGESRSQSSEPRRVGCGKNYR